MEQRQPTISPSYYYNRLHASTGKHHYGKHRQENGSGPMMHKRNGYENIYFTEIFIQNLC